MLLPPISLNPVYNALRVAAYTQWPQIIPDNGGGGIWEGEDIQTIPWEDLKPPFAAIVCGGANKIILGAQEIAFIMDVQLCLTQAIDGTLDPIRQSLEDMLVYLLNTQLQAGQVWEYQGLSWGPEIPGNSVFISKQYKHRVGMIRLSVILGYH
jgi:hypothetical protein